MLAGHCLVARKRPEDGSSRLHDAIDWSASLEKSQDCKTGGSRSEMLECMSTQNRAERIDLLVEEFQQLGVEDFRSFGHGEVGGRRDNTNRALGNGAGDGAGGPLLVLGERIAVPKPCVGG